MDGRFCVSFHSKCNAGITHDPKVYHLEVGTQTMARAGGDPATLTKFSFGEREGQRYVTVTADFAPGRRPTNPPPVQHQYASCKVYLDLTGDGSSLIPSSGVEVPYFIKSLGGVLNLKDESSKNF